MNIDFLNKTIDKSNLYVGYGAFILKNDEEFRELERFLKENNFNEIAKESK